MVNNTATRRIPLPRYLRHLLGGSFCALLGIQAVLALDRNDPLGTHAEIKRLQAPPACGDDALGARLTLAEVVVQALCRNPQTALERAAVEAQAAQLGVARGAYLPTLDGTLAYSENRGGGALRGGGLSTGGDAGFQRPDNYSQSTATLSLSYLLLDFGTRTANRAREQALLDAALSSYDHTLQTVVFNAVQAYYGVRAGEAALTAAAEAEKTSRASLDAAETRRDVGAATPADVLQARTAYSQSVLTRIQAEGNQRIAQGQLANAMGLDANRMLALAPADTGRIGGDFPSQVEALIAQARKARPDLIAAVAQSQSALSQVEAARGSGRPSLNLSASAGYADVEGFGSDDSSSVGLNLTIPLFTGFITSYRVRSAEAQARSAGLRAEQLRLQVALEVWNAHQRLTTASQALASSADLLASADQAQEVAFGRYKAGVGSVLDLLSAQSALASARQQRVQTVYDLDVARIALAQALGSVTPDLATAVPNQGKPNGAEP